MNAQVSYKQQVELGIRHLQLSDPVLSVLITQYPAYTPVPHTDYYYELVSSIISQQLSVKAAATIERRFMTLFDGSIPSPQQIVQTDIERLREVGLSRSKPAIYRTWHATSMTAGWRLIACQSCLIQRLSAS